MSFHNAKAALALAASCLIAPRFVVAEATQEAAAHYGLAARPESKAYLSMPDKASGAMPPLLSQTGAFADVRTLQAASGLIPYGVNVTFWSDGASKWRWISVPTDGSASDSKIQFAPGGAWKFPNGTVFVKHFELSVDETHPDIKRRLETRLLVRDSSGSVYGVTYKWRPDNSDAELLEKSLSEPIAIKTASGVRTQIWYYPSRQDCRECHTTLASGVLGVNTRQLNGDFKSPNGVTDNQLRAWSHAGFFEHPMSDSALQDYPRLARGDDQGRSLEDRARSYLDANCAQCHRPQGTVAYFDARYETPLARQGLIEGQVLLDEGLDGAHVVSPNDIWRSVLFLRVSTMDALKMPPLAHAELDTQGRDLLRQWIESLPGPPVLPPPEISPAGGPYAKAVVVTLREEVPGAIIRYTLDGSKPTASDPAYEGPITLTGPVTVRAKAFKPGYTKSITTQQTFIIGN